MSRESQVEENIRRAQQAGIKQRSKTDAEISQESSSSSSEKEKKREEIGKYPQSDYKSIMGASLSVLNTLESIQFSSGANDGGMYNSIAYIEYWSRDSSTKTQSVCNNVEAGEGIAYPDLFDFRDASGNPATISYIKDASGNPITYIDSYSSSLYGNVDTSGALLFNLSDNANVPLNFGEYIIDYNSSTLEQSATSSNQERQGNLSSSVPSSSSSTSERPDSAASAGPKNTEIKDIKTPVSGPVKSANPNGGWSGFFRNFLGLDKRPNGPSYTGKLSGNPRGTGSVSETNSCNPPGYWQFLFNPEEINWEGGPEYGEAETWGVTGDDNSGRPLFWKNMKNQKLVFSKVLLNGYVFGKRVDSLEKGLIKLFMNDDGDNPDGPPVLNFVWGEMTFGPCVIRDIRIKQKNWDNGVLVNAEVSFTLEKIPEWIVNDGYVDIARPARQTINGDVFAPPSNTNDPKREIEEPLGGNLPPGDRTSGTTRDPKKENIDKKNKIRACNSLGSAKKTVCFLEKQLPNLVYISSIGRFFAPTAIQNPDYYLKTYRKIFEKLETEFKVSNYLLTPDTSLPGKLEESFKKCDKFGIENITTGKCINNLRGRLISAFSDVQVAINKIGESKGCTSTKGQCK